MGDQRRRVRVVHGYGSRDGWRPGRVQVLPLGGGARCALHLRGGPDGTGAQGGGGAQEVGVGPSNARRLAMVCPSSGDGSGSSEYQSIMHDTMFIKQTTWDLLGFSSKVGTYAGVGS